MPVRTLLALGPAAAQPGLPTPNVGLVYLDDPSEPFTPRAHQHRSQPMQHRPRRLVGTDLQCSLQAQRGDAILAAGEEPAGSEPDRQRRAGPVEDRTRCHRRAAAAPGALEPSVGQPPAPILAASWANEAGGPSQPFQVVQTIGISPEPGLELAHRPRVVLARARIVHRGILHGRSG
jgi:hypothetical protein